MAWKDRLGALPKLLTVFVLAAVLVAAAFALMPDNSKKYVNVDFPQANSTYVGSDVRILGVPVGQVESITPRGDVVRVKLSYDAKYKVPADAKAVIVSPAIVGDRFVQLAPAYGGGKAMADNAYLNIDQTEVPVELDQIYQSLDDLSLALGPEGANDEGSLSRLLDSQAETLDGQGEMLNETITNFSKLSQTLSNNKDELFSSVTEVNDFVTLLKENDDQVRAFNDSTSEVSEVLEGEREDLAETLKTLSVALVDVQGFVKDNKSALRGNVDDLASLTALLAKHKESVEELTVAGPTAYSNLAFTYNPAYGTLDNRADLERFLFGSLSDPATFLCQILAEPVEAGESCQTLDDLLPEIETEELSGLASGEPPELSPEALPELELPRPGFLPRAAVSGTDAAMSPDPAQTSLEEMLAVN